MERPAAMAALVALAGVEHNQDVPATAALGLLALAQSSTTPGI
jgi:hypothetical protein